MFIRNTDFPLQCEICSCNIRVKNEHLVVVQKNIFH